MYINNYWMAELMHSSLFYKAILYTSFAILILLLVGCGGGKDNRPPPPNIAGYWSGTWEGVDSEFGPAAGTWEATISQSGDTVKGPISFSGDIDCAEGNMTGSASAGSEVVSGQVFREPCPTSDWLFTTLNQEELIASGEWEKVGLSLGSFEGQRIAEFTGPRIKYVFPPAGRAGAYVTIVGENLAFDSASGSLTLGLEGAILEPIISKDTIISLQLPGNAFSSDQLVLTTTAGTALSPLAFNTGVTNPNAGFTRDILLSKPNQLPAGIAASINSRRVFVANRGDGSVNMINSDLGIDWTSTIVLPGPTPAVPVHAVTVDPAGRTVYVAGENIVGVLHAHTLELLRTIIVPANGSDLENPKGIAVSPDGRWLVVSEAVDGGSVTILDVENNFSTANTLVMANGDTPLGIAISPDNSTAYFAVSSTKREIWAYDFASSTVDSKIVGSSTPSTIAVTPDASRLYIASTVDGMVTYYEPDTGASGEITLGAGVFPTDLAISADGFKVYVATSTNEIFVIDVLSDFVTPVDVGGPSSGVTISPDGKRAYVTLSTANKLVEIGNQRTLRISKQGGGIGEVTTSLGGIQCGNTCIASFDGGGQVRLIATADSVSDSRFGGWSGDSDCIDGIVTMDTNLFCVATFNPPPPPSPSGGGSGSTGGCVANCCFIATAAYGSWMHPDVETLRSFRDNYLEKTVLGRAFVDWYYMSSPPIAQFIQQHENIRLAVRMVLTPFVYAVTYPLAAILLIIFFVGWRLYRH